MIKTAKTQRRPTLWIGGFALAVTLATPGISVAQQPAAGSGDWYYQLGGASPISPSPNVNAVAITLFGSTGLQLPRACGSLDPTIAVSNLLGDIGDGADELDDLLVLAATEAIAALPAIILQRANPGLYEHFQNSLSKAKQTFDLSVKSCEAYVEDAEQGNSPFGGWVRQSKQETWQAELADENADGVAAEEEADTTNGDDGVLWLGGEKRGGLDQDPIPVIREATQAGYNLILGRDVTALGAPNVDARLTELWTTSEEAGEFATSVLGDLEVQTCQGCTSGTVAATGALLTVLDDEREVIGVDLLALVEGEGSPTQAELADVSSANVTVTTQLLNDLRSIPEDQDQALLVDRLAADIALARVGEQGLRLRRMLLTSLQVPEIVNNTEATTFINGKIVELEQTLDKLPWEARIQAELMSKTASIIGDLANSERLRAAGESDLSDRESEDLILQGRVRPQ